MVELTQERDVDTLRQISLLLDRDNQRLIAKNLQLTAALARLRGVTDPEQLALVLRQPLEQARAGLCARAAAGSGGAPTVAAGAWPAGAAGIADGGGPSRAPARSTRVSGVWRGRDRDDRPVRSIGARDDGRAHVSRGAASAAEVSLRVQRRGRDRPRSRADDPRGPLRAGVCGRGRCRQIRGSSAARTAGADDGPRGPGRRLADAVGSAARPGGTSGAHPRGACGSARARRR